jgi:hypothetical protein
MTQAHLNNPIWEHNSGLSSQPHQPGRDPTASPIISHNTNGKLPQVGPAAWSAGLDLVMWSPKELEALVPKRRNKPRNKPRSKSRVTKAKPAKKDGKAAAAAKNREDKVDVE